MRSSLPQPNGFVVEGNSPQGDGRRTKNEKPPMLEHRRLLNVTAGGWTGLGQAGLVQIVPQIGDGGVDQLGGLLRVQVLGEQTATCGDGDIDRQVLHFLQGERFGLGDLVQRLGLTPLHRGFQIGSGMQPQPLRFLTGMSDDLFGFLQRIALTALVRREGSLGILTQALRLLQFLTDLLRPVVQHRGHGLGGGTEREDGEYDGGEGNPELSSLKHQPRSCITAPTAASAVEASTLIPASFSAVCWAISTATERTLAKAVSLASLIRSSEARVFAARSVLNWV